MVKDFLTKDGALQIVNGDFLTGEPTQEHVQDVLFARPGEYSQSPFIGVDIEAYLKAPITPLVLQSLERQIRLQLQADGAKRISVNAKSLSDLDISCNYER